MTKLYSQRSGKLWLRERLKSFFIANSLKRLAAQNELKDYRRLLANKDQRLWDLHARLEAIRHDMTQNYASYDYGNGYFYQSMKDLNISGYRDTDDRVEKLRLRQRVAGKSVLDIGSNSGFVLLSLANEIPNGVGVEYNPYLVEMSRQAKAYMGAENIEFVTSSFEDYGSDGRRFDVVLSLANHSTYDGNTKQDLESYFGKISDILNDGGTLIFESHPPQIEPKEKLEKTLSIIGSYFKIIEMPEPGLSGFLDRNRTYVIGSKK